MFEICYALICKQMLYAYFYRSFIWVKPKYFSIFTGLSFSSCMYSSRFCDWPSWYDKLIYDRLYECDIRAIERYEKRMLTLHVQYMCSVCAIVHRKKCSESKYWLWFFPIYSHTTCVVFCVAFFTVICSYLIMICY